MLDYVVWFSWLNKNYLEIQLYNIRNLDHGSNSIFFRTFTAAFLKFLAHSGVSDPVAHSLTLT